MGNGERSPFRTARATGGSDSTPRVGLGAGAALALLWRPDFLGGGFWLGTIGFFVFMGVGAVRVRLFVRAVRAGVPKSEAKDGPHESVSSLRAKTFAVHGDGSDGIQPGAGEWGARSERWTAAPHTVGVNVSGRRR